MEYTEAIVRDLLDGDRWITTTSMHRVATSLHGREIEDAN